MTAEATVIQFDQTVRVKRLRDRLDDYSEHNDEFPRVVLALAIELYEARQEHESNEDFGIWLIHNKLDDLGKDDRAALIGIGSRPDISRPILQETKSRSVRLISQEVEDRVRSVAKTTPSSTMGAETIEIATPEPGKVEPAKPEMLKNEIEEPGLAEPAKPEVRKNEPTIPQHSGRQSPLAKLPNAAWVLSHIVSGDTRSMLGKLVTKRRNRPAWDLLVECIQNGTFGEPTTSDVKTPSLRLLFPWMDGRDRFVRSFDLTKSNDLEAIRTVIVPFLLKNPDRSARVTGFLADEVRRNRIEKEETTRRQLMHERHQQKLEASPLPGGQQEIIAFGAPLWPSDRYSYEEIAHACWFVSFIFDLFGDKPPLTKRMNLLHAMKFIEPMLSRGVMVAIGDVADAFVNNPTGAYKWPPKPQRFF